MSAEALGSVTPSDSRPPREHGQPDVTGLALAANWAATSTGRAPPRARTSAAARSRPAEPVRYRAANRLPDQVVLEDETTAIDEDPVL